MYMFENHQTGPKPGNQPKCCPHPPETIFTRRIEFGTPQSGNTEHRDSDR